MNRRTAREIALRLGFTVVMTENFAQTVLDDFFDEEHYATLAGEDPLFAEYPTGGQMEYIRRIVELIFAHRIELNAYIEKYARGWKTERISRTAAAIMRCAMCEVLYMEDIPDAAAINEAVELAKRYEDTDTVAFINGVLGGFMRGERDGMPPVPDGQEQAETEYGPETAADEIPAQMPAADADSQLPAGGCAEQ